MNLEGKLIREDIGAGAWVLESTDGKRWLLDGDVPAGLDGKQVRVEGRSSGGFGFAMTGDAVLAVTSVRAVSR